ncbi:MAG: flagellar basal body-associated FliL family protein [Rhodocyclaceae bacterium]|jgi:flagellar basal body-associated protein FliL|nr:flagellar basal body-associated FliL family protein [Rhodocyclaceae bacterium]MBK6908922.1 flagellar basal body-associated FliL family protein [Rhodocyclaceae bacterium]
MKRILLSLAFLMTSSLALASGGGGGDGGGAASSILKLDPLVVNLSGGHFLQFTPQLKLEDPTKADFIKAHTPMLRHSLILKLIGKDVNLVQTASFMATFSEEAAEALNKALKSEDVKMLLFDGWLVQ